jgi:hypothetical protein
MVPLIEEYERTSEFLKGPGEREMSKEYKGGCKEFERNFKKSIPKVRRGDGSSNLYDYIEFLYYTSYTRYEIEELNKLLERLQGGTDSGVEKGKEVADVYIQRFCEKSGISGATLQEFSRKVESATKLPEVYCILEPIKEIVWERYFPGESGDSSESESESESEEEEEEEERPKKRSKKSSAEVLVCSKKSPMEVLVCNGSKCMRTHK